MHPFAAGLYAPRNREHVADLSADVGRALLERFILLPNERRRRPGKGGAGVDGLCRHPIQK